MPPPHPLHNLITERRVHAVLSICVGYVWVLASGGAVVVVVTVGARPVPTVRPHSTVNAGS